MKKIFFLAAFVLGLAFSVSAQPAQRPMHMKGARFDKPMREILNLTDEQKSQIADLKIQQEKEMIDLQAQLKKNRLQIKELLNAESPDKDEIISVMNNNSEIMTKMKTLKVENWFKVYNLLDPSQKKIFKNSFGKLLQEKFNKFRRNGRAGMRKGFRRPPFGQKPPCQMDDDDK